MTEQLLSILALPRLYIILSEFSVQSMSAGKRKTPIASVQLVAIRRQGKKSKNLWNLLLKEATKDMDIVERVDRTIFIYKVISSREGHDE